MKTRFFPIILTLIFIIIFFLFYGGLKKSNIYVPTSNINKKIPNFKAKLFEKAEELNSSEIFKDDQIYLMNIWASWCVPCRDEHVFLDELSKEESLNLVGINYKDDFERASFFLKELGNPYDIILLDVDGIIAIEWGAYGVPESYLIKNKMIIKKIIGPLNRNLVNEIKKKIK